MSTDQNTASGNERLTNIYVIGAPSHRPVKIGKANDVQARLRTLQTASPYRLEVRLAVQAPASVEKRLHARFKPYWLRGEWFDFGELDAVAEVRGAVAAIAQAAVAVDTHARVYGDIPLWLYGSGAPLQAIALYGWLDGRYGHLREIMPSYGELATALGISRGSAVAHVKALIAAGAVRIKSGVAGQGGNIYEMAVDHPFPLGGAEGEPQS